ncbi:hypothetical protein KIPB_012185, partial [Kipferlia bialata]|eukprot:g12185.t1
MAKKGESVQIKLSDVTALLHSYLKKNKSAKQAQLEQAIIEGVQDIIVK